MHGVAVEIGEQRVGRELRAALLSSPVLDGTDERSGNAFPPMVRRDVDAFEESDGRGAAAFHVIAPQSRFGEAQSLAILGTRRFDIQVDGAGTEGDPGTVEVLTGLKTAAGGG